MVRLLVPGVKTNNRQNQMQQMQAMMDSLLSGKGMPEEQEEVTDEVRNKRLSVAEKLERGLLENEEVTIEVEQANKVNPMGDMMGQMGMDMSALSDLMPKKKVKRTLPVSQARKLLIQEEEHKLVDYDAIYQKAIERASQSGIIFIDESTRLPLPVSATPAKSPVKGFKEISCQSLKAQRFQPSMVLCQRITFSLLLLGPLPKASQVT